MTDNTPYLIVGLGNPGPQYAATRHNVGWMVLDTLAKRHGLEFRQQQAKAVLARGLVAGRPVILAKPQTYMNLSGQAVNALARFYKIPLERVLIIYDELDLPVGTIRLRERGSAAGHNGLTSVIQQLGTPNVPRLRIGISKPPRGAGVDWVLGRFSADERADLAPALERAADALEAWLAEGIGPAMNRFNANPAAEGGDQGSGVRGQRLVAGEQRAADGNARPAPQRPAPTSDEPPPSPAPRPLTGLGAQIAALQDRLKRRPSSDAE
jgi:PTH1 family peptidyl-tRNA hydrolase